MLYYDTLLLNIKYKITKYNQSILFISSKNIVWTICTYIIHTIHYAYITLQRYYSTHYTHTTIMMNLTILHMVLKPKKIPKIASQPFHYQLMIIFIQRQPFNKSIHMSTNIFLISHPMPLMVDDLCWTYKWKEL
jgi:hypothetical protein